MKKFILLVSFISGLIASPCFSATIFDLIQAGRQDDIIKLIQSGKFIQLFQPQLDKIILELTKARMTSSMQELVKLGVQVRSPIIRDSKQNTPLHLAAPSNENILIDLLSDSKNIYLKNASGQTALDLIKETRNTGVLKKWVEDQKINPSVLLPYAIEIGDLVLFQYLYESTQTTSKDPSTDGAPSKHLLDKRDFYGYDGRSLLEVAQILKRPEIFQFIQGEVLKSKIQKTRDLKELLGMYKELPEYARRAASHGSGLQLLQDKIVSEIASKLGVQEDRNPESSDQNGSQSVPLEKRIARLLKLVSEKRLESDELQATLHQLHLFCQGLQQTTHAGSDERTKDLADLHQFIQDEIYKDKVRKTRDLKELLAMYREVPEPLRRAAKSGRGLSFLQDRIVSEVAKKLGIQEVPSSIYEKFEQNGFKGSPLEQKLLSLFRVTIQTKGQSIDLQEILKPMNSVYQEVKQLSPAGSTEMGEDFDKEFFQLKKEKALVVLGEKGGLEPHQVQGSSSSKYFDQKGTCVACDSGETEIICSAGNGDCRAKICKDCTKHHLHGLTKNKYEAAICMGCKKTVQVPVYQAAGCDRTEVSELVEMKVRAKLVENVVNWEFCHTGECPNGAAFDNGKAKHFECQVCNFKGCLDCGINHPDRNYDPSGKCIEKDADALTEKQYALWAKQGKRAALSAEQLRELPNLTAAHKPGEPCPICGEAVNQEHAIGDHYWDGRNRPCVDCGMYIEKVPLSEGGHCNHMKCQNGECRGDFNWHRGDKGRHEAARTSEPMQYEPKVKPWWPGFRNKE